jgi:regulatory protein
VCIQLTDGSSFFVSPKDQQLLGAQEGAEISLRELSGRAYRHALELAYTKALDLLARREHTAQEIAVKLERRNFNPQIISECVAKLKDTNSIDETRFAEYYIASRLRRSPRGRLAIRAELVQRGVDRHTAEAAVSSYEAEHPRAFDESLSRATEKAARDSPSRERLAQRLARRGFSAAEVARAIEELGTY